MKRHKGYIRLIDDSFSSHVWELPPCDGEKNTPRETAINFDPTWSSKKNNDPPPLDFSQLTAEALENIRQSALIEGLKEGREIGFLQGKEDGLLQGKEEGFIQGRKEGYQKGLEEGEKAIQDHCRAFEEIGKKLTFPIKQIDHQIQCQVIEIINDISKAVLKTEVETNPKVILQTLQDVVATMPMSKRSLTIYLHPLDKKIIETMFDEASLEQYNWKLLAEPNFSRGDIQVACVDSSINFSMAERIETALTRFITANAIPKPQANEHEDSNVLLTEEKTIQETLTQPDEERAEIARTENQSADLSKINGDKDKNDSER